MWKRWVVGFLFMYIFFIRGTTVTTSATECFSPNSLHEEDP